MAPTSDSQQEANLRKRQSAANKREEQGQTKNEKPTYTTEQAEAVKRIKKCKDYYEILMVSKDATDSEIKKQYKKLALQLHPDKNHYPGAAEAFKAIGTLVGDFVNIEIFCLKFYKNYCYFFIKWLDRLVFGFS